MSQSSSFRLCSQCKAYNTVHVLRCYKCAFELPHIGQTGKPESREVGNHRGATSEVRQAERSALGVLGAVLEVNGEVRHDVLIENISVGGLLMHSDWPYQPFDRFRMLVPLESDQYVVEVTVRRSVTERFSQWQYTVGVEFVDPDPEFVRHISCLCLAGFYSFV